MRRVYVCLAAVGACGGDPGGPTPSPLIFEAPPAFLVPGQGQALRITRDGSVLPGATYVSSAPGVARMRADTVEGVAPGSATITARVGGTSATLTIQVREGGLARPGGGIIESHGGAVRLLIPAGAVSATSVVEVVRITGTSLDPTGAPSSRYLIGNTALTFATPATLSIRFDPSELPHGLPVMQAGVRIESSSGWDNLASSTVEVATSIASAPITGGGSYSVGRLLQPSCPAPAARAFDFWIGEWRVVAQGQEVGRSAITRERDGCAIREEYADGGGGVGRSISFHEPGTNRWYQTYVDGRGARLRLSGALTVSGELIMFTPTAQSMERWSWFAIGDGSVRQVAARSTNGGTSFQAPYWDAVYTRR